MLIHSIPQLLTLKNGPQRGKNLGDLGIVENGAVRISGGVIDAVGDSVEMRAAYPDDDQIDSSGSVVVPGFVDAHTHVVWAGDRAQEFEQRLEGKTYLEILVDGGGILSTVAQTRAASVDELVDATRTRLQEMFAHGTTTIEAKTGYGLETETELKLLQALKILQDEGPWDLVITFLGAHAIPAEYEGRAEEYTDLVREEMLPAVLGWWQENCLGEALPFVDVFCETGAFSLEETRKIFTAADKLGFPLKLHADEFDNLGGTSMGVEVGAVSIDHLVSASDEDIKRLGESETVAVGLPGTPFGLAEKHYAPAKRILDANGILAIASDINPGTSWCENMQMVLALACRYMQLTPAQAIAAVTINGAAAIGRAGEVGSIEVGKLADMLMLRVPNYRQLGYRYGTNLVKTVIKRGEIFEVKEMDYA